MNSLGPIRLMYRLYRNIFPAVNIELEKWKRRAAQIPDPELRKQALASIESKTFHCEGGCVYAATRMESKEILIPLIVAYQTISDYLDNLCDRSTSNEAHNFEQLHQAMLDAVSLCPPSDHYYKYNNEKADGGYLKELVLTCQREIRKLPTYQRVKDQVNLLSRLYCDLQVHKHVKKELREQRLLCWWREHKGMAPDLMWHEFAAAAGSTLGIFHLFEVACSSRLMKQHVNNIMNSYFPWICSLHILLDYLIDLEEDNLGGDLNFISYYQNPEEIYLRLTFLANKARIHSSLLPDTTFHHIIIDGLLGLYLSDGKVLQQPVVSEIAKQLFKRSSLRVRFFFWNGRVYRGKKAVVQEPPSIN
jgi:tetraprenyl-beta-curcumene synthase